MTDPISVVRQFFDGLNTSSLDACCKFLAANVTDDFVWENTGLPTVNGPAGGSEFLASFGQAMPTLAGIKVDLVAIAAAGNTVVTERVDHLVDGSGTPLVSLPLAGTLVVSDDGRISAWRDYFDPRPFLG